MGEHVTYGAVFLAGMLSFLSPCFLPLAPPYICYLAGVSVSQLVKGEGDDGNIRRRTVSRASAFALGFTTVFVFLGASASVIGRFFIGNTELLSRVAGFFVIIMGLHVLGVVRIPLLNRDTRYAVGSKASSYVGAYAMGLAFAFGWTPCIGPVLATVLLIASQEETVYMGMSFLATYSLGLGMPFIFMAFAIEPVVRTAKRFQLYLRSVEIVTGTLIILTGIAFMTGGIQRASFWLLEVFPWLGRVG